VYFFFSKLVWNAIEVLESRGQGYKIQIQKVLYIYMAIFPVNIQRSKALPMYMAKPKSFYIQSFNLQPQALAVECLKCREIAKNEKKSIVFIFSYFSLF